MQGQHCVHSFAVAWVGQADDDHLAHGRMLFQHAFDLARVHVVAAGLDHLFEPPFEFDMSIGPLAGQVARLEPAVGGEGRACGFGFAKVAGKDQRTAALDLAGRSHCAGLIVGVGNAEAKAGFKATDGVAQHLVIGTGVGVAGGTGSFGLAVFDEQPSTRAAQGLQGRQGGRAPADADAVQMGQRAGVEICMVDAFVKHRRHLQPGGDGLVAQQPQGGARRKALLKDRAATAHQGAQCEVHQAAHVVDRQVAEVTRQERIEPVVLHCGGVQQPGVREHGRFGPACGARREDDGRRPRQRHRGGGIRRRAGRCQPTQRGHRGQATGHAVEVQHRRQRGLLRRQVQQRIEVAVFKVLQGQDQTRLNALHDLGQFRRRAAWVEPHVDAASAADGHQQQQVFGAGRAEQRHTIAGRKTQLAQPGRHRLHQAVHMSVGPGLALHARTFGRWSVRCMPSHHLINAFESSGIALGAAMVRARIGARLRGQHKIEWTIKL